MMKLIASVGLLAFFIAPSSGRFGKYHAVEAYEIKPGIIVTPVYSASQDLCEIGIEKRHYSNNNVDMEALLSKEQILSLFDEIVPREERGHPGLKFPLDTEITETDSDILTTRIPYENVSLAMYGTKGSKKYVAAIISWNTPQCNAK